MDHRKLKEFFLFCIKLRKRYQVQGDSMWPTLQEKEVVYIKPTKECKVNDIVAAQHPFKKLIIIKRVKKINKKIQLRGDNDKTNLEVTEIIGVVSYPLRS